MFKVSLLENIDLISYKISCIDRDVTGNVGNPKN